MPPADPVRAELRAGSKILHLLLDAPKANVLDARMIDALVAAIESAAKSPGLRAIVFEGAGPNFSFGASVPEHTRAEAPGMLRRFHGLFHLLARLAVPTAAIVRGACLGGGCELASYCTWIFAANDAVFAQPEIKLAVFPPMASLILPWRMGGGRAADLCVSGRKWTAAQAVEAGLATAATAATDDPAAACFAFLDEHVLPQSASSLRFAERAARASLFAQMETTLRSLEDLYVNELMATPDANEGIGAFLEKRKPRWIDSGGAS